MKPPDGFRRVEAGAWVRAGYEADLAHWRGCMRGSVADAGDGGRGKLARVPLRDGAAAFVRRYRRGGWAGAVLGETYFGRPPRPWRELVATEAARRAGVVAPEVLAAVVEPVFGAVCGLPYRGVLVTRELGGRRTLREALLDARAGAEVDAWLDAVIRAVRQLHACGIRHPDLNVTNLLVGASAREAVAVIDFDRAVVGTRPVGRIGRLLAHRRLARSVAKLELPALSRTECRRRLAELLLEAGS